MAMAVIVTMATAVAMAALLWLYRGFPIIRRLRASFSGILKGFQPIIRKFVFVA